MATREVGVAKAKEASIEEKPITGLPFSIFEGFEFWSVLVPRLTTKNNSFKDVPVGVWKGYSTNI